MPFDDIFGEADTVARNLFDHATEWMRRQRSLPALATTLRLFGDITGAGRLLLPCNEDTGAGSFATPFPTGSTL